MRRSSRLELSTTQHLTRLQLGHLRHHDDNRRLHTRGHGFDLYTQTLGAVRAGSGLLVSTHAQPGSHANGQQLEARDALQQLQQGAELLRTLAHSAQQHQAQGTKNHSLATTQQREAEGGGGAITARWGRPDLVLASPQTLSAFTPATLTATAGGTITLAAGQYLTRMAQGHTRTVVQGDVSLYTYGRRRHDGLGQRPEHCPLHARPLKRRRHDAHAQALCHQRHDGQPVPALVLQARVKSPVAGRCRRCGRDSRASP